MEVAVIAGEDTTCTCDDAGVCVCCCGGGVIMSMLTPPLAVLCVRCDMYAWNICACCVLVSISCLMVSFCPLIISCIIFISSFITLTTSINSL